VAGEEAPGQVRQGDEGQAGVCESHRDTDEVEGEQGEGRREGARRLHGRGLQVRARLQEREGLDGLRSRKPTGRPDSGEKGERHHT
jgi:hypothetical protein